MIIAVDAMGGDNAPKVVVQGALLASKELPSDVIIKLIGDNSKIKEHLNIKAHTRLQVEHTTETIEMHEHPTRAFSQKPNSSIGVGFRLLKEGKIKGFCGAGNTGAMMIGALFTIKTFENIMRAPIAGFFPVKDGGYSLMLDVGANAECKPEVLNQFAELGSLYVKFSKSLKSPKVALLNIGEEEQKGTTNIKAAHQLMKANPKLNFIGNVESRSVFDGKADVVVTEGFTGNVVFKMGESIYEYANSVNISDPLINRMNYEEVGGCPIIGVRGNVVVAHGISTDVAIKNMILLGYKQAKSKITEKFEAYYQKASNQQNLI